MVEVEVVVAVVVVVVAVVVVVVVVVVAVVAVVVVVVAVVVVVVVVSQKKPSQPTQNPRPLQHKSLQQRLRELVAHGYVTGGLTDSLCPIGPSEMDLQLQLRFPGPDLLLEVSVLEDSHPFLQDGLKVPGYSPGLPEFAL